MAGYIGGTSTILTSVSGNEIGADELNVEGNGTAGQALTSDGDGSMTWATLASDAISEGNSSVEVVDTGTGHVAVTVDGTEEARFNSTGLGIATNNPSHPLHVLATGAGQTTVKFESNQAGSMNVALDVDTDRDCLLQFQEAGTTRWDFLMNGSSGTNPLLIRDDGGTTQASFDQSGNFKFNSGYGSAATAYGCRAFVNFDGTGTVSIRRAGNVSSITDNGSGDYTINFSTAMVDDDYTSASMGRVWPAQQSEGFVVAHANYSNDGQAQRTTSSLRIAVMNHVSSLGDSPSICVSIFR